jgi:hypothetical protein
LTKGESRIIVLATTQYCGFFIWRHVMSEVERNKGKLFPLFQASVMQEDHLDDYLNENYETKMRLGDWVYDVKFEVERDTDSYDFADVNKNEDGTISFHTMHYNGVCLSDVIVGALKKLDK